MCTRTCHFICSTAFFSFSFFLIQLPSSLRFFLFVLFQVGICGFSFLFDLFSSSLYLFSNVYVSFSPFFVSCHGFKAQSHLAFNHGAANSTVTSNKKCSVSFQLRRHVPSSCAAQRHVTSQILRCIAMVLLKHCVGPKAVQVIWLVSQSKWSNAFAHRALLISTAPLIQFMALSRNPQRRTSSANVAVQSSTLFDTTRTKCFDLDFGVSPSKVSNSHDPVADNSLSRHTPPVNN